jgi:hypothetical protein
MSNVPLLEKLVTAKQETYEATLQCLTERVAREITDACKEGKFHCTIELNSYWPPQLETQLRDMCYYVIVRRSPTNHHLSTSVYIHWL